MGVQEYPSPPGIPNPRVGQQGAYQLLSLSKEEVKDYNELFCNTNDNNSTSLNVLAAYCSPGFVLEHSMTSLPPHRMGTSIILI